MLFHDERLLTKLLVEGIMLNIYSLLGEPVVIRGISSKDQKGEAQTHHRDL